MDQGADRTVGTRGQGTILYKERGHEVQGVLRDVFRALAPGFREETYRRALSRAPKAKGIPFQTERAFDIRFRDEVIDQYRADLVVDDKIIVEIKAVDELHPRFEAQLLSYLRASRLRLGLLVNFGSNRLQIIRKVM